MDRRTVLNGAGTATATALAGCTDLLDGDNGYEETGSTGNDDVSYELDFSLSDSTIDLSSLPTASLDEMDESDLEYIQIEDIQLYEDGEEYTDIDQLELLLENQNGETRETEHTPESENIYELACTELLNGENQATLKARKDGETVAESSTTLEKIVPETYRAQIIVDGENFDDYQTPFSFDNVEFTEEEYQELRQQHINEDTWNEIVRKTLNNERHQFHPDLNVSWLQYSHGENEWITSDFENKDLDELEEIIQDAGTAFMKHYVKEHGGSGISGRMNRKAATAIALVDPHINDISAGENRYKHTREIDLEGGHISTGGHGNALYYERNTEQWINYDPDGGAVTTPAEAPDAKMKDDRFYAPTDYELGHPDNHEINWTVSRKKSEGVRALTSIITTVATLEEPRAIDIDDHWIKNNLEKIENNQPLGQETETMLKTQQIARKKTGKIPLIYGGDTGQNHLLITENGRTFERFRENPEPVTTTEVENEILN